jgi:hypothetical protein
MAAAARTAETEQAYRGEPAARIAMFEQERGVRHSLCEPDEEYRRGRHRSRERGD